MTDLPVPHNPRDGALDALVANLIDCGGVLSQIVNHMLRFEQAGLSAPDSAAPPAVLHGLLVGVLDPVAKRYSTASVKTTARLLEEAAHTICDEVFMVPLSTLADSTTNVQEDP
jgi:hypothetical protein